MYIFGLVFYVGLPAALASFESSGEFIKTTFNLAPEIAYMITVAYVYPLLVFILCFFMKNSRIANVVYFRSQVDLASTLAVSFGLIGTFIGLAEMIGGIAAGMGAEGDFATKMNSLLTAISSALDSMSFAFLTSILGIGASSTILFCSNYMASYFKEDFGAGGGSGNSSSDNEEKGFEANSAVTRIEARIQESLDLIANKEKVWGDLHLLLENNTGTKVVDSLNDLIQQNNQINLGVSDEIKGMRIDQNQLFTESNSNVVKYSERVTDTVSSATDGLMNVISAIGDLKNNADKNSESIGEVISKNINELDSVSLILNELRVAVAPPLHELLVKAIADDLIELRFQPQKNQQGVFVGGETFVHWEDALIGKVNNLELFEQAEEHGLVERLDIWIMDATFRCIANWVKDKTWGSESTLSINVSATYFLAPSFIVNLENLLEKYSIPPSYIALEITENTLMSHSELCQDKIRQTRQLGVKLYIDDFGTGYTSMKNLRSLQIDMLKIDRTIVRDILENSEGESVVRSIMSMALELNIQVAAEGIESQEQIDKLLELGCTVFQGYYLGRPAGIDEFHSQHVVG